jgi:outer membrane protein assembly factor BamB
VRSGRKLTLLATETGAVLWQRETPPAASVLVRAPHVYLGGGGEVYCYSLSDGELVWKDLFSSEGMGEVAFALGLQTTQVDRIG